MAKGFGGGFGMGGGNMQALMRQAQQMQEKIQKAQQELEETEVEGSAGGEMVTVTMNGKKRLLGVSIKQEAVDPDDVEMLEDLILAAYNDAYEQAEELEQELMPNMPGMM